MLLVMLLLALLPATLRMLGNQSRVPSSL